MVKMKRVKIFFGIKEKPVSSLFYNKNQMDNEAENVHFMFTVQVMLESFKIFCIDLLLQNNLNLKLQKYYLMVNCWVGNQENLVGSIGLNDPKHFIFCPYMLHVYKISLFFKILSSIYGKKYRIMTQVMLVCFSIIILRIGFSFSNTAYT